MARSWRSLRATALAFMLGAIAMVPAALAAATGTVCDAAAERAARESGVPKSVLLAITRTETGRNRGGRLTPWPWTVNMEGAGRWFDNRAEARAYVQREFERGARSFDVGCFQINYKWHGSAFKSIDQMFDPVENARYAASFLTRLHGELGDWSQAAGAYHSRTPKYATRYRARFNRIHAKMANDPPSSSLRTASVAPARETKPTRENHYPLLQGGTGLRGSLVPLREGSRALISLTGGS